MPVESNPRLRFRFALRHLPDVQPWDGANGPSLHWFGLTLGEYWIEAGDTDLLRYAVGSPPGAERNPHGCPVDYHVVRLWEDVLEWAPAVLEPIPDDLAPFVEDIGAWELGDMNDTSDEVMAALDAIGLRALDLGYLVNPPLIWAWRASSDSSVTVAWRHAERNGIAWGAPASGQIRIPPAEFEGAVRRFHDELMAAMEVRVAEVVGGGLDSEIEIDVEQLLREQSERRSWLAKRLRDTIPTDWELVRAGTRSLVRSNAGP